MAVDVHEIIAIGVLVGVVNPNLGKEEVVGLHMAPFEKALVTSYRPSIVTFLYLKTFQRYCHFYAPARHSFPTPPAISPKFLHVPRE